MSPARPAKAKTRRTAVADRWGLPGATLYVALPEPLRLLLVECGVPPAGRIILYEILDSWRPASGAGTCVTVSARDLGARTGLAFGYVATAIRDLASRRLLRVEATHGRRTIVDLAPLLSGVRCVAAKCAAGRTLGVLPSAHSVLPSAHQCAAGRTECAVREPRTLTPDQSNYTDQSGARASCVGEAPPRVAPLDPEAAAAARADALAQADRVLGFRSPNRNGRASTA